MAVKLRLRRMGRKKRPYYRIVAADSRSPRDGRFIEEIGTYNPIVTPSSVEVQEDRALYWLGVGAIPTTTVKNLLSKKGIILRHDLSKRGLAEDKIEEEMKKWEVLQLEKARRLELAKAEEAKKKQKAEPVVEEAAPEEAVAAEPVAEETVTEEAKPAEPAEEAAADDAEKTE